jgi:hypothetical protein
MGESVAIPAALTDEQQERLRGSVRYVTETAESVTARLIAEFKRFKEEGTSDIFDPNLADARPRERKFALLADQFIEQRARMVPYFRGVRRGYEIGVGPGYLFTMLQQVLGIEMRGCDVDFDGLIVYRELRRALGIEPLVSEFRVAAGADLPIPPGTDAVIAVAPVFDMGWDVAEHRDFLGLCRAKGVERMIWRLNKHTPEDILKFYRGFAQFPMAGEDRDAERFCIVPLQPA